MLLLDLRQEANYSQKPGLPNFSSLQFSVTIKTEVPDPAPGLEP